MTSVEIVQIILSFFVGGGVILSFTLLAERLGSRLGGIIAGIPTTIAVSLLFQGIVLGPHVAAKACGATLVVTGLFGAFCASYVYLVRYGIIKALLVSCVVWGVCIIPFIFVRFESYWIYAIIFIILATFFISLIRKININAELQKSNVASPLWSYIMRFFFGGFVIALAVSLSISLGEVIGGIAAAFPAMAISSIIILNITMGQEFTALYLKNVYKSAVISCSTYVTSIYLLYPSIGLLWGTAFSYLLVIFVTYFITNNKRLKKIDG